MLWTFPGDLAELSGLSLAVAIAIRNALEKYGIPDIALKWPNDVLWNNRKIAGTLIELRGESHYKSDAVIGIGLNLNMPLVLKQEAQFPLVDIAEIIGKKPERNKLTAFLIESLIETLTIFQSKGLKPFIPLWTALDNTFNKRILLTTGQNSLEGIHRGIDDRGCLIIEEEQGKQTRFSCGEVSLHY